ncbi:type IX secretion system periplasmic lipoprotein PorW/SprE [Portibacter marinus]|uniref:type IX secretion system periplasmic lipoprotein PorW/SprE n=1 Tax=Portibacter marinus TaxID=2898660 RepID=UPI001F3DBD37|nr:tetratricopeptide repeat protein [Portibacter marinus]
MRKIQVLVSLLALIFIANGCTVQKKRGEVGKLGKIYHNTTAKFNGYFNADVIMQESEASLNAQYQENYNKILPIYPYTAVPNAKSVSADLDKAIEKVSIVATIHEPSHWVDDCYVLLGQAQYMKQDYEAAEKTFEFFVEEFDPLNKRKSRLKKDDSKRSRKASSSTRRPSTKKKRPSTKKRSKASPKSKDRKKSRSKPGSKKRRSKPGSKQRPAKPGSKERPAKTNDEQETNVQTENEEVKKEETPSVDKTANDDNTSDTRSSSKSSNPPNTNPKDVLKSAEKDDMFGHEPVYQEGILWLARTYIHRERFSLAEYYLDKVEGDPGTPKDVRREIPVVRAFYHLKRKDYASAAQSLEQAIEISKNKEDKARYTFILAQLNQQLGLQAKAFEAYNAVIKMHPDYEMEFNAALNMSKAAWASGQESSEKTIKRLENMADEEKNFAYRDQIYFTIGTIHLQKKERDLAIENFRKSIKYNVGNATQNAESYFVLANYFYEEEEYADAKYHYDSTLLNLPKSDERYDEVQRLSENLKDIATNIDIIKLQDSLLRVSEMSPERQREIAAAIKKQQELNAKPKSSSLSRGRGLEATALPVSNVGSTAGAARSDFFAYDMNKVRRGQNEFRKVWGSRQLEDNWRRSNKPSSSIDEGTSEEAIAKRMTDEEVKGFLGAVPFSEKDKKVANQKIEEALFNLGKLYREKLEQFSKAAESLEDLYGRNAKTDFREEAYYYSYLSYMDLNNQSKANFYKAKLVSDFPDSKYTLSITDPNYAADQLNEAKQVERKYEKAYALFEAGQYEDSKALLDELKSMDITRTENVMAKVDLLSAMVDGNLEGKDAYITSLNYVVKKHPNTPEEVRAKEILRFVKGDDNAFNPVLYNESVEDFKTEPDKLHYMLVVLYSKSSKDMTTSKIDISAFNQKNFKDDKLKISNIFLNKDEGSQIILVRKFQNQDLAMDYYNEATKNSDEFIKQDFDYEIFAVTQKSYREIVKQKSTAAYKQFFEQQYLNI